MSLAVTINHHHPPGKSTLVGRLTNVKTTRHSKEQARNMTIKLGTTAIVLFVVIVCLIQLAGDTYTLFL
jgi:translation initiation factor 2 gamma subunit (eIF-2gamma)